MIARLYSNENFPLPVVMELRRLGHDVLTTHDIGNSNAGISDEDVLRFASDHDRVVLTHNRQDFIRLHRQNSNHAGIIVCTDNPDFSALAAKVHAELLKVETLAAQLIRVNRGQ